MSATQLSVDFERQTKQIKTPEQKTFLDIFFPFFYRIYPHLVCAQCAYLICTHVAWCDSRVDICVREQTHKNVLVSAWFYS